MLYFIYDSKRGKAENIGRLRWKRETMQLLRVPGRIQASD